MPRDLFKEIDKYIDSLDSDELSKLAAVVLGFGKNKDTKSEAHMKITVTPNNDDKGTYEQRIEINGSTAEILPMLVDSTARVLSQLSGISTDSYDMICNEIAKQSKEYKKENKKGE